VSNCQKLLIKGQKQLSNRQKLLIKGQKQLNNCQKLLINEQQLSIKGQQQLILWHQAGNIETVYAVIVAACPVISIDRNNHLSSQNADAIHFHHLPPKRLIIVTFKTLNNYVTFHWVLAHAQIFF